MNRTMSRSREGSPSPFRAWRLPSGFVLGEGEISGVLGDPGREFVHPRLGKERTAELLAMLREARERGLVRLPVQRVVEAVDRVARRLLDPHEEVRRLAVRAMAAHGGYSDPMAEAILDGMARGWTGPSLRGLLESEFRDPGVLDEFQPGITGERGRALGYPLTFHLGAGTVPGVSTTSAVRALLVKSAVLLKPGLGDLALPVIFARALADEDPELADSLAVAYWPPDEAPRTEGVLAEADLVVAYGSDETVRWIRGRAPARTVVRTYRHRLGVALIGRGALEGESARAVAREVAGAVAVFDQRGCVSPHVVFLQRGGQMEPEAWAELLAGAFSDLEGDLPSGEIAPEEAVALQQLRGSAEMKEGLGDGLVLHGGDEGSWTVVVQERGRLEPSCLNRSIRIVPVDGFTSALRAMAEWTPFLQTVGLAGFGPETEGIVESLARLGASRIVSISQVPWPRPWWHHDGSGPLLDLVRWTDLEGLS